MTSPSVERALELVGKLFDNAMDFDDEPAAEQCAADLRSAIRAIGASEWRGIDAEAREREEVTLLCQAKNGKRRIVHHCSWSTFGHWFIAKTDTLSDYWTPLAWKPADSTELPAELEGK